MDEVSAIAILDLCIKGPINIIRTRDMNIIKPAQSDVNKYVVDVGGIYDQFTHCYDHHQSSFNDSYSNDYKHITPLSSCGMIYKDYARQLVRKLATPTQQQHIDVNKIVSYIYSSFILPIDAHDNGVSFCENNKIRFHPLQLGTAISQFNSNNVYEHELQMTLFIEAVNMMKTVIRNKFMKAIDFEYKYSCNLPIFKKAFNTRENKYVLILDTYFNTTQYLKEFDTVQTVKYIISPNNSNRLVRQWNIHTVTEKGKRFSLIAPLISYEEAIKVVGNEVIFIHKGLFTGATLTKESAIIIINESHKRYLTDIVITKSSSNILIPSLSCLSVVLFVFFDDAIINTYLPFNISHH